MEYSGVQLYLISMRAVSAPKCTGSSQCQNHHVFRTIHSLLRIKAAVERCRVKRRTLSKSVTKGDSRQASEVCLEAHATWNPPS